MSLPNALLTKKQIEAKRQYGRNWYLNHKEQQYTWTQKWKSKHGDQVRKYMREYMRKRSASKPGFFAATSKKYRQTHPERWRAAITKSRAKRRNVPIYDLTVIEWQFILEWFGHRCFYCGKDGVKLELEHMTPLSRGGSHTAENVAPACRLCNAHKHTQTAEEFLAQS